MTTITLNAPALLALIEADPNFYLQVKNHVLAEIGRRMFEKDAKKIIAQTEPELFKQALAAFQRDVDITNTVQFALKAALIPRDRSWYEKPKLSDEAKKLIDEAVSRAKTAAITNAVDPILVEIQKRVQEKIDAMKIDERIEKRVDRLVEEEIERRANERFQAQMAKVREAMRT
ncbi:hypothetical protein [Mesorhizobium sp. WSM2239]|uniref:DUF3486 family protein n=2 Tax=unclassified Mesorhizobium TaxID=325217 RepID=A0AAU8DEY9_9HYPH